jgi:hypothetical protein
MESNLVTLPPDAPVEKLKESSSAAWWPSWSTASASWD